jgi:hypothetical protein
MIIWTISIPYKVFLHGNINICTDSSTSFSNEVYKKLENFWNKPDYEINIQIIDFFKKLT